MEQQISRERNQQIGKALDEGRISFRRAKAMGFDNSTYEPEPSGIEWKLELRGHQFITGNN